MTAASTDKSYNRLFIVANHSEVIYPMEQRELPTNMTVATLTQMNQTIHVKDGQIPTDRFRHLFSGFGERDSRGFAPRVLPTDSDVMGLLSRLSAMGIVYATHNGKRQPCDFRQRKDQAEMTVQMCFLPGGLVHSGIYEFSPTHETGMDVSDVILGQKVNPGMQLYRETSDKDRTIIEIEKMLMDAFKTTDCPPDHLIIERSHGDISQEDIDRLRKNRENYKNAIQFGDSINEFCSHAIEDVERLREELLQLVIRHDTRLEDPQLKWVMRYQKDEQSSKETLSNIFVALKKKFAIDKKDIPALKLTRVLTHNVLVSIYRSTFYSDYKSVTTGHTPLRSDELFDKIRKHSGDEKVYVVFIGCRHVPSSDPADLAVMHSPKSGRGDVINFMGGRKVRRRNVNKPKTRKISKRIHKKIIINRSQHRSHRR